MNAIAAVLLLLALLSGGVLAGWVWTVVVRAAADLEMFDGFDRRLER
jgi:hypothetical protein